MEHRIELTAEGAFELSQKLEFINTSYVKDEYTGTKRIRQDPNGVAKKKIIKPKLPLLYIDFHHCAE